MSNIAAIESHVAGDQFTAAMWTELQNNINDGVVNQVCAAAVQKTASYTIPTTAVGVTFDTELYDGDTIHDPVTNPSRLTCKTAGVYAIGGCCEFPIDASAGKAFARIVLNGGTKLAEQAHHTLSTTDSLGCVVSRDWFLNIGDYVELWIAAATSGLVIPSAPHNSLEFWMHRV